MYIFRCLLIVVVCICSGNLLAQDYKWWDYSAIGDRFDSVSQECGLQISDWKRGAGASPISTVPSQFISRGFVSTNYAEAIANQDYVYFSIVTDAYTTVEITGFTFLAAKSAAADSPRIVLDYGLASESFSYEVLDSFIIGTMAAAGTAYNIDLSVPVTIEPSDSAVFRLVVSNDLGSALSTMRICNNTGFHADVFNNLEDAFLSVADSHICYSGTPISIPVMLTGTGDATAYFSYGDLADSVVLSGLGTTVLDLEISAADNPALIILDSVKHGCHHSVLNADTARVVIDSATTTYIYGFLCGADSFSFLAPANPDLPPGPANPNVLYYVTNADFTPGLDTMSKSLTFLSSKYCDSAIILNIKRIQHTSIELFPEDLADRTICEGAELTLTAISDIPFTLFNWRDSAVPWTTLSTTDSLIVSPSTTSTYICSGTIVVPTPYGDGSQSCLVDTASIEVVVNSKPVVSIITDIAICEGNSLVMTSTGALTYLWLPSEEFASDTGASVTITGSESAFYTVVGTSNFGCIDTADIFISVFPKPDVSVTTSDDTVCYGTPFLLTANGAETYTWESSPGLSAISDTTASFIGVATYQHRVIGVDSNNCIDTAYIEVVVNDHATSNIYGQICNGESILFNGALLGNSGIYLDTLISDNGCDSVVTFNLVVMPQYADTITASICEGSNFIFDDDIISAGGTYTHALSTVNGCDSIRILNLSVNSAFEQSISASICEGTSYLFGGDVITSAGTYVHNLISAAGCDSVVTLNLIVKDYISNAVTAAICSGSTYNFGGSMLSSAGEYIDTFSTAGCDSIVKLSLSVNSVFDQNKDTAVCFGDIYEWGDMMLSTTGVYTQLFTTAAGCDSTVTMNFTVKPAPAILTQTQRGCGFVVFEGSTYDSSTVLTNIYKDTDGCDSFKRVVNIQVRKEIADTVTAAICKGDRYRFNRNDYTSAGAYTDVFIGDNGCDSSITLLLKVNPSPEVSIEQLEHVGDVCILDTIKLRAKGALDYYWTNIVRQLLGTGSGLATVIPLGENYIHVIGTDENGCSDSAIVIVKAQSCCDLQMPNAFSPNGDGLNDNFGPVTYGNPLEYQLQIFDRWGKRVFVSFRAEDMWDGLINGEPALTATYFWKLNGICVSGQKLDMKGDLMLIR